MTEIKLIKGDCLDILPTLKNRSVDLILTDPAYESMLRWQGVGTTARMGMGKKGSGSDQIDKKFFPCIPNSDLPDLVQECHRILKDERHAYFMCDWETLKLLHTFAIEEGVFAPVGYGGKFEPCKPLILDWTNQEEMARALVDNIEAWLKDYKTSTDEPNFRKDACKLLDCIGQLTDDRDCDVLIWDKLIAGVGYTYRPVHEYILMLWKGKKRKLNNRAIQDVLRFKKPWGKERIFPTQKPVKLMELLIQQSTFEGETVLDPFLGSGTTAVACVNTGRNFIGIEVDDNALEIAKRRIEEAQNEMVRRK